MHPFHRIPNPFASSAAVTSSVPYRPVAISIPNNAAPSPAPSTVPIPAVIAPGYRVIQDRRTQDRHDHSERSRLRVYIAVVGKTWTVVTDRESATVFPTLDHVAKWATSLDAGLALRGVGRPILDHLIADGWKLADMAGFVAFGLGEAVDAGSSGREMGRRSA